MGQAQQPSIESLLAVFGPEFTTQYKLDKANAIIEALQKGRSNASAPTSTSGGAAAPQAPQAPQAPGMGSPMLSPMFYRMFNSSPQNMQGLVNSIVRNRRRPMGMI